MSLSKPAFSAMLSGFSGVMAIQSGYINEFDAGVLALLFAIGAATILGKSVFDAGGVAK